MAAERGHGAQRDDGEHGERDEVHEGLGEDRARNDGEHDALRFVDAPAQHDHAHRLPEPAGEDRRGHDADHRRAHDGEPVDHCLRQRGPQRLVPGHRAQHERERHQRHREHDPSRVGVDQGVPDVAEVQPRERERDEPSDQEREQPDRDTPAPPAHLRGRRLSRRRGRGVRHPAGSITSRGPRGLRAGAAVMLRVRSDEARSITAAPAADGFYSRHREQ